MSFTILCIGVIDNLRSSINYIGSCNAHLLDFATPVFRASVKSCVWRWVLPISAQQHNSTTLCNQHFYRSLYYKNFLFIIIIIIIIITVIIIIITAIVVFYKVYEFQCGNHTYTGTSCLCQCLVDQRNSPYEVTI